MELQHIFLFIAIASSSLIVAESFRVPASAPRRAALAVLVASGLGWLIARPIAGYIAAILWCGLLLFPAMLRHRTRVRRDPFYRTRSPAITISPVVLALILLNAAVFLIEILFGGPENPLTLYRLGELDTVSVLYAHQHWRLFTALFLHYGVVHLVFNMFALLVLGPPLERQIGAIAFAVCYLLSGLGSSISVVFLAKLRLLPPLELVGASGCVMGIVGAWGGFLLRNRDAPLAARRLHNVVVIVAMQIAFDLMTPNVSMSAHLGGLVTGFLLGFALRRQPVRGI
jgi:membrane associated rhomboid family serine protease